jgi:hypothetical protein
VGAVAHKLIGVNAADGALLWQFPWMDRTDNPTREDPKTDAFICGPALCHDGRIFMTNRRKEGGVMLDLAADGKSEFEFTGAMEFPGYVFRVNTDNVP